MLNREKGNPTIKVAQSEPNRIIKDLEDIAIAVPDNEIPADYCWDTSILLFRNERKTLANLFTSLASRQLPEQLVRISLESPYTMPVLILQDYPKHISKDGYIQLEYWTTWHGRPQLNLIDTGYRMVNLQMLLVSCYYNLGILPVWVEGEDQVAEFIRGLYNWSLKPEGEHGKWLRVEPKLLDPFIDPRVAMLTRLPHVGEKLGMELLNTYKTVRRTIAASRNRHITVKGIGKTIAEDIERFLDWEWEPISDRQLRE